MKKSNTKTIQSISLFSSSLLTLTLLTQAHAAGGDMLLDVMNRGVAGGAGVPITVTVYDEAIAPTEPKVGAEVEIVLHSPRPGQQCEMVSNITDEYGQAQAVCYSLTPELLTIQGHELGDDETYSPMYQVYFDRQEVTEGSLPSTKQELNTLRHYVRVLFQLIGGKIPEALLK